MSNVTPADALVREEVINPEYSFVVSAPAGSGKTGLLTHRVLNLLTVVEKPEEILAITFTRKAAAEMHLRIFSCLEKAHRIQQANQDHSTLPPYERALINSATAALKRSESKGWDLLNNPGRLSISTIDGFSKSICNQLPFFSGVGSQTSVITNPLSEYRFVTQRWILYELKSESNPDLDCLIDHFSGNIEKLVEMFSALLGVRDQWLPLVGMGTSDEALRSYFQLILQSWVSDALDKVLPVLSIYEGELFQLFKFAEKHKHSAKEIQLIELLNGFEQFPQTGPETPHFWRAFSQFCLTKDKEYRKSINKNLGFPSLKDKHEAEECKRNKQRLLEIFSEFSEAGLSAEQLAKLQLLPDTDYDDLSWQVLDAMTSCLPKLVAYLKLRFAELSCGDFVEFSLSAVAALDHNMGEVSLMQRLDYRIQHILIDEFQDTSQTQLNLLRALTKDWLPDDGKSLFLVGDGMQSCYGFRNANVGIFLRMKQQGLPNINLKPCNLTVNFRSDKPIVDWVNKTFTTTFPASDDVNTGAVKYVPSISFSSSSEDSHVHCNGFKKGELDEAEYIANEIQKLQGEKPDESIAILARSRPHLSEIIAVLKSKHIDYQAIDLDPLGSKQHITDIDSLARFLFDQSDRLSFLALLRSPFCGLNHADLYTLFHPDNSDTDRTPLELLKESLASEKLSEGGAFRLNRFFEVIFQSVSVVGRRNFSECVEKAWFSLGGPECLESALHIRDIQTYLNLLAEHEQSGGLQQWDRFETSLEKEFADSSPASENPIQVMTMHKSKGLEFDTVFLPSLEKRKRNDDEEVLYWLERLDENLERRFILSPIDAKSSDSKNTITAYIKAQRSEKNELESTRIFYVACTRAKKRLYLSAKFDVNDDGVFETADKSAFISRIWDHVENEIQYHAPNQAHDYSSNHAIGSEIKPVAIKALPENWKTLSASIQPENYRDIFDNTEYDFSQDWSKRRQPSRAKGIVVHQVLQLISKIGISKFHELTDSDLGKFVRLKLQQEGIGQSELEDVERDVAHQISGLKCDDTIQWIFSDKHLEARSEWSLWSVVDGEPRESIIDRSFIELGANDTATRWILDYKTTEPESGASIDDFFAMQLEQHRTQLLRYRKLVAELDNSKSSAPKPALFKVGLYFPAISAFKHYEELDLGL